MSDDNLSIYSCFGSHIRSELRPEDLSRAAGALQRAAEARRRIINLHRSASYEEEETRQEIVDLIQSPNINKLNKLFKSPVNILPSDMKYDEATAENTREFFRAHTAEIENKNVPKDTPKSTKFDSIEDFDAWRDQLHTINPTMDSEVDIRLKPLNEQKLELSDEIEQCVGALKKFEAKFSNIQSEVPDMPNRLNEDVHQKIKKLSKIIDAVNEFTRAKASIMEGGERVDAAQQAAAARSSRDVEDIICQVENLAFPTACDD